MRRIAVTIALLLGTVVAAQAVPQTMYKDLIRPSAHKRSDAVFAADVDACYRQTGDSRNHPNSAAMKKCMSSRGYRFMWQRGYASGGSRRSTRSTYDPTLDFPPQVTDPATISTTPVPIAPAYDTSGNLIPGTGM